MGILVSVGKRVETTSTRAKIARDSNDCRNQPEYRVADERLLAFIAGGLRHSLSIYRRKDMLTKTLYLS